MNRILKGLFKQYLMEEDTLFCNNEIIAKYKNRIKELELKNKEVEEDLIDIKCLTTEVGIDFQKYYKEYKEYKEKLDRE